MTDEARLEQTDAGLVPAAGGWFVVNAADAPWGRSESFGTSCSFEGEERPLKAWDFVHCPAGTEHIFVGAGSGPCVIVMAGSRAEDTILYPISELAQKHGAGVEVETPLPREAYARFPAGAVGPMPDGTLPGP